MRIAVESKLCTRRTRLEPKAPSSEQHRDLVKAARDLGVDESEEAFDKALRRVASAPPPKPVQKRKKNARKRT
jgi:hypothetical protein